MEQRRGLRWAGGGTLRESTVPTFNYTPAPPASPPQVPPASLPAANPLEEEKKEEEKE